jgi:hypothetical protein
VLSSHEFFPLGVNEKKRKGAPDAEVTLKEYEILTQKRNENFKRFGQEPPSDATVKRCAKLQTSDEPFQHSGRPPSAAPIPISLLHQTFGHFYDDCKSYVPTETDYRLATAMANAMSEFYVKEDERALKFRKILLRYYKLDLKAAKLEGTPFQTDGHATSGTSLYVLAEVKNEIGAGGAEPFNQTGRYYWEALRPIYRLPFSGYPCLYVCSFGTLPLRIFDFHPLRRSN